MFLLNSADSLHSLSHPGIRATQKLIAAGPTLIQTSKSGHIFLLTKNILKYIRTQRSEVHKNTVSPMSTFTSLDTRLIICMWI